MKNKGPLFGVSILGGLFIVLLGFIATHHSQIVIFNPRGSIALQERNLILLAFFLMSLVVIPVFGLTFYIAWKYRENNHAAYHPDWDHNVLLEFIWWAIPCAIIAALGWVTWTSSHSLDPTKPLSAATQPLTVEVVALPGKWLFIYPEQHLATVSHLELPTNTPINFHITSDAPMNSFWIPQLGGQIYAMPGMSTQLHLIADHPGIYQGSSANLSGTEFADMRFPVHAAPQADFNQWISTWQTTAPPLTDAKYQTISQPKTSSTATFTLTRDPYNDIIMKYMNSASPSPSPAPTMEMKDMDMSNMNMQ